MSREGLREKELAGENKIDFPDELDSDYFVSETCAKVSPLSDLVGIGLSVVCKAHRVALAISIILTISRTLTIGCALAISAWVAFLGHLRFRLRKN